MLKEIETKIAELSKVEVSALSVNEAVRHLKAVRDLKDAVAELAKSIGAVAESLNQEKIPTLFKETGTTSTTVDGYRYTMSNSVKASIMKDKRDDAFQWLRDNELGELITETVNASTLSAQARILADEGMELDPDLFNVYVQPNMSVTKVKS